MAESSGARTEDAQARERELFRVMVESARDFAIFTTDRGRRIRTWNVGAERLLGWSEAEALGQPSDMIFTPEDRAAGAPEREGQAALRDGSAEDERWHLRRDGTRFWGSGQMIRLESAEGGFAKLLRDRTDRKQGERRIAATMRALEASEARARMLVAEVRDYGIYMIDPEGQVQTWNAGAQRLTGYAEEEVIGRPFHMFFTAQDVWAGEPQEEMRTAEAEGRAEKEGWRVRKDGTLFWASEVLTAVRGADGRLHGFTKIVRDLTERRRAEEALVRARDELEVRVRERTSDLSRALASLEHEVNERKQTEQARRELLRRLVTVQEEERRRIARELHDEMGQHLTALLLELKMLRDSIGDGHPGLRRLEALQSLTGQIGREVHRLALELRPTALDDLGLQNTLVNYLDDWSERTGVAVDFHGAGAVERHPPLIETSLYRIVQEALTNVVKHSGATRVGVVLERRSHSLHLILEDNGRGFDPEAAFAAAEAGPRRLGLLGMRERVGMVGGTLTIESRPGGPSTLFVRVPLPGGPEVKGDDD